ncbi:MAG: putative aminohydrolase SsnA [Chloroflexi bacterium]|nr:MAG: putative aminohydrolase SsnA [Chloroflexota bacterium]MBL1195965.1 putative aminohydrolase SsnA [Chloroflexota bacterium]NOH13259.1 putative aminohydrolase SsnA [Chloroflexota bacterium]
MLITNGKLITWGEETAVLVGQAIYVQDGLIAEIGPEAELKQNHPDAEIVDANGQYVMPGNICAHTHFYGAYARGMAIPGDAPEDFPAILKKLWWPLDKALDEDSVRASALVHLVDAVKHGTTTLIDHHASPNFIDGSLDVIADTVEQSGLRAALCYEVTDRDGEAKAQAGIAENLRFIERAKGGVIANGRVGATFGLHASLTLTDETLKACREAVPEGYGFHVHVAEHEADEEDSLAKSQMRVVNRLNQHGILGPNSITAHCIHIDDAERALLKETDTWVTHQPRSNMNNGVGVAAVETMLGDGIRVCLGNDGFTQDMWTEWKIAYLLHKVHHRDPRRMNGMDVVKMAVTNNADLAAAFLPDTRVGVLETGAKADLIFVDYHPFTPLTEGNAPWQVIFGFNESMVTTTIVDGQLLMHDRKLLTLDEEAIAAEAMALAPDVWARYNEFVAQV